MLLFDDGTDQLLFDCHATRPSISKFLCGKPQTDTSVADTVLRDFPMDRLRAMFISHSHHDHAMNILPFAGKCGCTVYGKESALNVAAAEMFLKSSLKDMLPARHMKSDSTESLCRHHSTPDPLSSTTISGRQSILPFASPL